MKTKWIIVPLLFGILMGAYQNGFTQDIKDKKEQIKKERKDFINRWCGFTEAESGKFWQLHDEMDSKLSTIRKEDRTAMRDIRDKGIDNMSENDLKKAMENRHTNEQKQLDIRWEYNQKFIDAVGVRKTARFYEGLKMFRKTLLDRVKDHHLDDDGEGDGRDH